MANLVQEGLQVERERYHEARAYIGACQARVSKLYEATPVMLVPAATGRRHSAWRPPAIPA